MTRAILTLITTLLVYSANGQKREFPREINLIFDYLIKKDYPELFNDKSYQFRPINWQIVDINDDGNVEVFLQTFPHYTQSPSIIIFTISKNDSVTRITEGFAPGHLIPLSPEDDYFSPHSTATAIDMQIDSNEPKKLSIFAEAGLKFEMSSVLYKNFIHTDRRKNKVFLDLTYLTDYVTEVSCQNFQFSKPDEIAAGKVAGSTNKFFVARVGNELFCYEIKGFENNVYINKTVTIIKAPQDLIKLAVDNGSIKYVTGKDGLVDLKI